MEIFYHHIYEYQKGIRNLVLHSTARTNTKMMISKLNYEGISYLILPVGKDKVNVFFGDKECIDIIKNIGKISLCDYTAEEDFILGIMLGYDRKKQCERFLKFKNKAKVKLEKIS